MRDGGVRVGIILSAPESVAMVMRLGEKLGMAVSVGAALFLALAARGEEVPAMTMTLTSSAFVQQGSMPARYSCDGANASPPLAWKGLPDGTKSLALIVADPDAPDPKAPKMTWAHWVLYDVPPDAHGLREAIPSKGLPPGTLEGANDWGKTGYGGPCPPIGRHRYIHTLYALDTVLPDLGKPTRAQLLAAMEGHVLGTAELVGTYQRQ
jgi:Raf kinase inhibitor-like YbhB/YbcL family protein